MTYAPPLADHVTGLLLAGGEGRRMGGVDKGLQSYGGQALTAHVLARLAPQVSQVIISANRNLAVYEAWGWPVVRDAAPADGSEASAYLGPLAGVLAGMTQATSPWLLTCPCDVPHLPLDLLARLAAGVGTAPLACAWHKGKAEPAFMLCRTNLAPQLAAYLASGQRRIFAWQQSLAAARVDFDADDLAFANCNTLADLSPQS